MREFRDALGRAWNVHMSCSSLKRSAEHAGFDIADISNGKAVELFSGNVTHLLDILWPFVKADAESRGISHDSFGDGLRGDSITSAIAVLKEELLDFFPRDRRALMEALLRKMEAVVKEASEQAVRDIESAQPVLVSGGTLPTSAPESSESVPTTGL